VFSQLLLDFNICHILSITPSQLFPGDRQTDEHHRIRHINIDNGGKGNTLLSALLSMCEFIHDILSAERDCLGRVLFHCESETRACTVIGAYRRSLFLVLSLFPVLICLVMFSSHVSAEEALSKASLIKCMLALLIESITSCHRHYALVMMTSFLSLKRFSLS
jgi:hypothetical protein